MGVKAIAYKVSISIGSCVRIYKYEKCPQENLLHISLVETGKENKVMVLVKNKKRSAETSPASAHCKKRRVVVPTPQKSDIREDVHNDENTPKKLAEVFSVNFEGLNESTCPATVAKYFGKFGEVTRVHLPRVTSVTGESQIEGSGSVTFSTKEAIDAVLSQTHLVDGQRISVHASKSEATPRKKRNPALRLFIGNIPKKVGKKQLVQHFSQFGNIEHIYLPTKVEDRSTHRGIAFIEFSDELGKKKAMAADKHEVEVEGKVTSLRISKVEDQVHVEDKFRDRRLYVGCIPKEVGKKALQKHFSQFGPVKHLILPTEASDCSVHKGFAFVEFADKLDREEALAARQHKFQVDGKVVSIRVFDSKKLTSKKEKEINHALELFVGKIPKEVGKKELEEHFSQFGNIKSITLPTNPEDRSVHKGVAFIEFGDKLAKEKAETAGPHKFQVNEKVVSVRTSEFSKSTPKKNINKALQLFVGKIPKEVGKEELEEHFSQFGHIKSIALPTKPEDRSVHKGFAFIEFADELAKEEALAADKHEFEANEKVVSVHVSEFSDSASKKKINKALQLFVGNVPKEVGKEELEEHFSQFGNIKSIALPTKPEDRSVHKGVAFIEFADELAKEEALAADDHEFNVAGKITSLRVSQVKVIQDGKQTQTNKLPEGDQWVNNSLVAYGLSPTTTAQTLSLHFSRYGKVEHVKMTRHQGKHNSAIVAFEDEEGVSAALEEDHEIDYSSINVKKATLSSIPLDDHVCSDELRDGEQISDDEDTDMEYDEESEEDGEEHDAESEEDGEEHDEESEEDGEEHDEESEEDGEEHESDEDLNESAENSEENDEQNHEESDE